MRKAKATWEARHDKSLIDRLNDELSGDFRRLCLTLLKGDRFLQEVRRTLTLTLTYPNSNPTLTPTLTVTVTVTVTVTQP